jgi:hypothetical protein
MRQALITFLVIIRGRNRSTRGLAAFVTAVTLSAMAIGAPAAAGGVPHDLVGTWGKSISEAAFEKDHVAGEPPGHYAIKVGASGHTDMYHGNDPTMATVSIPFTNMQAVVTGHTVTFGPTADGACPGKGIYRWAVSGAKLTFTLVKEGCAPREVLMTAETFALEH